jgi:hypothetical protein
VDAITSISEVDFDNLFTIHFEYFKFSCFGRIEQLIINQELLEKEVLIQVKDESKEHVIGYAFVSRTSVANC